MSEDMNLRLENRTEENTDKNEGNPKNIENFDKICGLINELDEFLI